MSQAPPPPTSTTFQMKDNVPQQLVKGIQVVLAGHEHAEDVPSDLRVHPLLSGQFQDFGGELKTKREWVILWP